MSWLSHALGLDYHAPVQAPGMFGNNALISQLSDPNFGMDQLQRTTAATVQNALPSYLQNLQGTKEDNIRRGISTGDLGTSFENDLTSAFQRNVANSVAQQSAGMFSNRTNLLAGLQSDALDREQAAQNNASQKKSSLLGGLLGLGGDIIGAKMIGGLL